MIVVVNLLLYLDKLLWMLSSLLQQNSWSLLQSEWQSEPSKTHFNIENKIKIYKNYLLKRVTTA